MSDKLRLPQPSSGYDQRNEAETRRLIELAFLRPVTVGGGSGLGVRREVTYTSGSLTAGDYEEATFDVGAPGAVLRTIEADRASRVRFYATAAAQASDVDRAFTTPPQAGTGILGDFIWLSTHQKIVAPHLDLFNADDPVTNTVYITITNLSTTTGTVEVIMDVVSVEAEA